MSIDHGHELHRRERRRIRHDSASFTINSATSITATSPAGTGTVDVRVITPVGVSATSSSDQYAYSGSEPPVVTSLSPTAAGGPTGGGTSIAINGVNFLGATGVKFGTVAAASFTVNNERTDHRRVAGRRSGGPCRCHCHDGFRRERDQLGRHFHLCDRQRGTHSHGPQPVVRRGRRQRRPSLGPISPACSRSSFGHDSGDLVHRQQAPPASRLRSLRVRAGIDRRDRDRSQRFHGDDPGGSLHLHRHGAAADDHRCFPVTGRWRRRLSHHHHGHEPQRRPGGLFRLRRPVRPDHVRLGHQPYRHRDQRRRRNGRPTGGHTERGQRDQRQRQVHLHANRAQGHGREPGPAGRSKVSTPSRLPAAALPRPRVSSSAPRKRTPLR